MEYLVKVEVLRHTHTETQLTSHAIAVLAAKLEEAVALAHR